MRKIVFLIGMLAIGFTACKTGESTLREERDSLQVEAIFFEVTTDSLINEIIVLKAKYDNLWEAYKKLLSSQESLPLKEKARREEINKQEELRRKADEEIFNWIKSHSDSTKTKNLKKEEK